MRISNPKNMVRLPALFASGGTAAAGGMALTAAALKIASYLCGCHLAGNNEVSYMG
jgi:hypothetical protein